jgi:hypothetical protein
MSDSPIFDQLVSEFAAKGAVYEEFTKWSTPAFRWTGSEYAAQQTKGRGIRLSKTQSQTFPGLVMDTKAKELLERAEPLLARKIGMWVHQDVLEANGVEIEPPPAVTGINDRPELLEEHKAIQDSAEGFGLLLQNYVAQVGQSFAETHPLAIVTDMTLEANADDSTTLVIGAVQPITPVKPLSERNTAQPTE